MKKRFTEQQIIGFLKEAEAGMPVKELCRKHGFSDASFYTWRAKFGGMEVSEARRLKGLEVENARLKKLLAEAMLDMEALKVVVKGSPEPASQTRSSVGDSGEGQHLRAPRLPACRAFSQRAALRREAGPRE
ncbi:transposase family protein [Burkholderia mallei]|nr:transposase family protein [Burkholderia mallei]AIO64741.1 transposase family protein [Burkholderia mallei]AIP75351.1 transposase family protein [Burkholderia mallei]